MPYSVTMTKCDLKSYYNSIQMYVMQIVYNRLQDVYVLFTRWGGVGEDGMHQKTPHTSREEAIKEFKKIFRAKTGNTFGERFSPFPEKYSPVKNYTAKPVNLQPFNLKESPPSQLPTSVQDLLKIFTDISSMRRAIAEASDILPLGNLEHTVIEEGNAILEKMRPLVTDLEEKRSTSTDVATMNAIKCKLILLSDEYFTKIPCKLNDIEAILTKDALGNTCKR
ncbi:WGR domain-containing protein [Chytridium lagenaria]|nr:WGR domain-containing protein [Chytridium lagenaria]